MGDLKDEMSWDDTDCVTAADLTFGNDWVQPDKDIIDKAIERAEAVPYGERIDFGKVLYGEEQ